MDIIMAGKVDPERDTKAKTMTSYKKKNVNRARGVITVNREWKCTGE